MKIDERLYTFERAKKFFDEHCILMGSSDVIPFFIFEKYFGKKYLDIKSLASGKDFNIWGGDDGILFRYLYWEGFKYCLSFYNRDICIEISQTVASYDSYNFTPGSFSGVGCSQPEKPGEFKNID